MQTQSVTKNDVAVWLNNNQTCIWKVMKFLFERYWCAGTAHGLGLHLLLVQITNYQQNSLLHAKQVKCPIRDYRTLWRKLTDRRLNMNTKNNTYARRNSVNVWREYTELMSHMHTRCICICNLLHNYAARINPCGPCSMTHYSFTATSQDPL